MLAVLPDHSWEVHFWDRHRGYVVGHGVVLQTVNGGVNWVVRDVTSPHTVRGITFTNLEQGWRVGERFECTLDGGITSTPSPTPGPTPETFFFWRQEAERGAITPLITVGQDPAASGEQYVYIPTGSGASSQAAFNFRIPRADIYYIWW